MLVASERYCKVARSYIVGVVTLGARSENLAWSSKPIGVSDYITILEMCGVEDLRLCVRLHVMLEWAAET